MSAGKIIDPAEDRHVRVDLVIRCDVYKAVILHVEVRGAEVQRLRAFTALHRWEYFGVAFVLHLVIRHKVCVVPAVTHHNFTDSHTDWSLENRTVINKGMKFAIFTAGIDIGRQLA